MLVLLSMLACRSPPHADPPPPPPPPDSKPTETGTDTDDSATEPTVTKDCDPDYPEGIVWESDALIAPSDGVVTHSTPWTPVMVHITQSLGAPTIKMWVDCKEATDPWGLMRARQSSLGGGSDYIAYLDLRDLSMGPHEILLRFESEDGKTTWYQGGNFWVNHPPNKVTIYVNDSDGNPVHARVVIKKDGELLNLASPDYDDWDLKGRDTFMTSFYVHAGVGHINLPDGNYELIATRSPFHSIDIVQLDVTADTKVSFTVDEAIDLTGWSTGDFHVHTGSSVDSFLPHHIRVQALEAVNLDVAVISDHDKVQDIEDQILDIIGPERVTRAIPGVEATVRIYKKATDTGLGDTGDTGSSLTATSIGHMNAFPMKPGTEVPFAIEDNLAEHLDIFREYQKTKNPIEDGILQLNHPRGIQMRPESSRIPIHDLFNELGFDRNSPPGAGENAWMTETSKAGNQALSFDALEVANRGGWEGYTEVRKDWLAMLGWGKKVAGTGNSDSHAMNVEYVGFPVNMVPCVAPEKGENPDTTCWVDAIHADKLRVSNGPVVDLSLMDGKDTKGMGATLVPQGEVTARITVRAAAWVPVPEVRLIVNGEEHHAVALTAKHRDPKTNRLNVQFDWPLGEINEDSYVLAEAGHPPDEEYPKDDSFLGYYADIAPYFLPMGFTNPVWIDHDGDGWSPGDTTEPKK